MPACRCGSRNPAARRGRLTASLDSTEPGLYRASLLTLAPGVHRIDVDASRGGQSLGRTSVQVLAGGTDPEFVDPRRNDAVLRRLGEATGGALLEASALDGLPDRIRKAAASPDRTARRT